MLACVWFRNVGWSLPIAFMGFLTSLSLSQCPLPVVWWPLSLGSCSYTRHGLLAHLQIQYFYGYSWNSFTFISNGTCVVDNIGSFLEINGLLMFFRQYQMHFPARWMFLVPSPTESKKKSNKILFHDTFFLVPRPVFTVPIWFACVSNRHTLCHWITAVMGINFRSQEVKPLCSWVTSSWSWSHVVVVIKGLCCRTRGANSSTRTNLYAHY